MEASIFKEKGKQTKYKQKFWGYFLENYFTSLNTQKGQNPP